MTWRNFSLGFGFYFSFDPLVCIFRIYLVFLYHSLSSFKVALGKSESEGHKALLSIPQGGLKFTRTDCQHNGLIFRASGNRQHTPLKPFLEFLESKAFVFCMGRLCDKFSIIQNHFSETLLFREKMFFILLMTFCLFLVRDHNVPPSNVLLSLFNPKQMFCELH